MEDKVLDKAWKKNFNKAKKHYQEYGNLDIEDKNIQIWLKKQRFLYKNGKLDFNKAVLLTSLDIDWFPEKKEYAKMLDTLEDMTADEIQESIEYQQLYNVSNNENYLDIRERLLSILNRKLALNNG
ncbi:MAG: helicase associated domain-containing protein [Romboutsia timonensis]|uniref:helicase associated domain-containing protein n=1 Tax=Romboutsia timonensis TaxID=1776391 RepID=UPI0039A24C7B